MSASSSPMRDNLPSTSQNNIPSTSLDYMPSTSLDYMPSTSLDYMPSTSQNYMPSTSQNYMPSTSQNYMPSTSQNYMPSTSQNYMPSTSQNYMPSTSQNNLPSTSQNYMPSTSQNNMPSTLQNYMPSTSPYSVNGIAPTQINYRTVTLELDNVCRVCLFQDEHNDMFINILDNNNLMDDILAYFQIQVLSSDSRSKMICRTCIHYIEEWHQRINVANDAQLIQDFLTMKAIEKASKSVTQNTAASEDIPASENVLVLKNTSLQIIANSACSITEDKMFLQSDKEMDHPEEIQTTSSTKQTMLKTMSKARSAAFKCRNRKLKKLCIFCNRNSSRHSSAEIKKNLCVAHSNPYTCLCENCNYVFPNRQMFVSHYRHHLNLDRNSFLCSLCFEVLDCPRNTSKTEHKHQNFKKLFVCCSSSFLTMINFVMHKLQTHNASILRTPADIRHAITQSLTEHAFPSNVSEIDQSSHEGGPKLFTCLESNCDKVFSLMSNNCDHYREHANIPKEYYVCSSCLCKYDVENELKFQCSHSNYLVTCHQCNLGFTSLHELAKHKIYTHNAIILCGANNLPGCPVCRTLFQSNIETRDHYIACFNLVNNCAINNKSLGYIDFTESADICGSYMCKICGNHCKSAVDFVEHSRKVHRITIKEKDEGIRLCPLCDTNYTSSSFITHVEMCTRNMAVENTNPLVEEAFGCVYCKTIFTVFSASQFRKHVLFCKTFQELATHGLTYFQCLNCTFKSRNHPQCVAHANTYCIYFQLKIKYAMKADEKLKVEQRIQLLKSDSDISFQSVDIPAVVINHPSNVLSDNNDIRWNTNSTLICNSKNFKTLDLFNYVCNNCENKFFNEHVFRHHLDADGKTCRMNISWYCTLCLLDFENEIDYQAHLSVNLRLIPVPMPIPFDMSLVKPSLKTELLAEDSTSEIGDEDMQDLVNENNLPIT